MVNRNPKGVALLLVVSRMALVTLLVVSLAMITRVETQVGIAQSRQQKAQETARLALDVALGRLQKLAGPDQRVTTTAGATGETNNIYWTGVWDATGTGTTPEGWLVSGNSPNPSSSDIAARNRIELVAGTDGDLSRQVTAPLVPVVDNGTVRGGASERINWDQYFPDDPMKLDEASPGFLTSADLMTNLSTILSPRSDIFVIRTYGEAVNATAETNYPGDTDPQSRAWLEAVVQRFPEGVSTTDFVEGAAGNWNEMVADPNWGRRFRILSLRWLTEEDL